MEVVEVRWVRPGFCHINQTPRRRSGMETDRSGWCISANSLGLADREGGGWSLGRLVWIQLEFCKVGELEGGGFATQSSKHLNMLILDQYCAISLQLGATYTFAEYHIRRMIYTYFVKRWVGGWWCFLWCSRKKHYNWFVWNKSNGLPW